MEVWLEHEARQGPDGMGSKKRKKSGRPAAMLASTPTLAAQQAAQDLCQRHAEWLQRLTADPGTFAQVEREIHEQARRHADRFVAGLLAEASQQPAMEQHVAATLAAAAVPLRPVEKKDDR